ncbi:MAG: hypothetical protein ACKERG_00210 [Candidatus Hodgkinia cicadicola]
MLCTAAATPSSSPRLRKLAYGLKITTSSVFGASVECLAWIGAERAVRRLGGRGGRGVGRDKGWGRGCGEEKWVSAGVEYRRWKLEDCAFSMFETWLRFERGRPAAAAKSECGGRCVLHWKMMG